jgi:hypothetical protein
MVIGAVVAALVLGFLAGLLSFKIKVRWCPRCGATLRCAACTPRAATVQPPQRPTRLPHAPRATS